MRWEEIRILKSDKPGFSSPENSPEIKENVNLHNEKAHCISKKIYLEKILRYFVVSSEVIKTHTVFRAYINLL